MKRSTGSGTGSRSKRRPSLRLKLFLAILGVTLACTLFFALLSNYLVRRQFDRAFEGIRIIVGEPMPPPPPPHDIMQEKQERLDVVNLSYIFTGLLGVLLAFILSYYLSNRISKPLAELTEATRSIAGGEYGKQVGVKGGREVGELGEAFNYLSEGLERNEMLRKKMVADISHELRNPLAAQRGHLEALQDGVIDFDPAVVGVLLENNMLLSHIVEDLRQLSLVDAGQIELELMPLNVADSLRTAASGLEREFAEKNIVFELDVEADLPAVQADGVRIAQVLGNLLRNALMYTPEGGSITAGARRRGSEIAVFVSDSGPGIEGEELPYIFERFYRTDKSRTRDTGGSGLGLSIANGLVEAHGGRIWAESEVGQGTTIFFTLPLSLA